jgi:hypothetical protein
MKGYSITAFFDPDSYEAMSYSILAAYSVEGHKEI